MKKAFAYITLAVLALSSCQTTEKTARTVDAQSNIRTITVADLRVADQRVTARIDDVSSDLRRGGEKNVKQAVEQKALAENGGGDLLLDPQYVVTKKKGLFSNKITSISVSGRQAWYQNFRSLNDSIWNNPAFRQVVPVKSGHRSDDLGRAAFGVLGAGGFGKQQAESARKRGWRGNLDLYLGGGSDTEHNDATIDFAYMVTANYGYQFSPYFYWGIGAGYSNMSIDGDDDHYEMIPIFHDFRFYTSRKANSWFLDLKIGGGAVLNFVEDLDNVESSFFVAPAIGYSWGRLELSAFFMHNEFEAEFKEDWNNEKEDFEFQTWGVKLGLRF